MVPRAPGQPQGDSLRWGPAGECPEGRSYKECGGNGGTLSLLPKCAMQCFCVENTAHARREMVTCVIIPVENERTGHAVSIFE